MSIFDVFKERFLGNPGDKMTQSIRGQPFVQEHWLAEDAALAETIGQIPEIESQAREIAQRSYVRLLNEGKIPQGKTEDYRQLCLRNARRHLWNFKDGVQDELAGQFTELWRSRMEELGVLEKFKTRYVSGVESNLVTTFPDEPYF